MSKVAITEFIELRRRSHASPELAFQEHATAKLVADKPCEWGYQVTEDHGGTSVVRQLKSGGSQRAIGIRADMDALPITEASLLAVAKRIAQEKISMEC